jgi:uroporphyrin-III C-methyltransferase / precorrin-2 dehydrogenase / sirohydrochlorin ferrochelatase
VAGEGLMHSLPLFVRLQGRAVILLGEGDAASAKRALLERAGAEIVGEDSAAALAIVALEDEAEAQAAVARLKARGILVNAVDRPSLCDFTLPAIIDRDPVLIAIGTGGASAGLAKALRQRLEGLLPQSLGAMATALQAARGTMRARFPDATERRRAIDDALNPSGPLDVLVAHDVDAVAHWLASPHGGSSGGYHHLIITSDDPDDLTLAQARLLGQADQIFHSPEIAPAILARGRADAVRSACSMPPDPPFDGIILYLERR